jgi:hypothetical protein
MVIDETLVKEVNCFPERREPLQEFLHKFVHKVSPAFTVCNQYIISQRSWGNGGGNLLEIRRRRSCDRQFLSCHGMSEAQAEGMQGLPLY